MGIFCAIIGQKIKPSGLLIPPILHKDERGSVMPESKRETANEKQRHYLFYIFTKDKAENSMPKTVAEVLLKQIIKTLGI